MPKQGSATGRGCLIVLGYVVRGPLGGMVWSNLQFLQGLMCLGYEVWFVEDSDDYPLCYDPQRDLTDTDPSYGLAFARTVFNRIGLGDRWAYYEAPTARWLGAGAEQAPAACARADVVLNLCGINPLRSWLAEAPARVLVDEDPAFTQIRHLTDPAALTRARQHTHFFSFAENIGTNRARIPDDGLPWQATRQPVVLEALPPSPAPADGLFTTVMQWQSYAPRAYKGIQYGLKAEAFAPYLDLPARTGALLELAVAGANAPRAELTAHGWRLRDPAPLSRDPWTYEDYLRGSRAEFSVAKHGYVVSRSGWFSERSAAYLAIGRPVVLQDTGYTDWLPAGDGVLAFSDPDGAAAAIADVTRRYEQHCRAARIIAQRYFDARTVLGELLARVR
ncbi:hypothetical protein HQ590_08220 [bacterium]|nr:hypothetical protein [bacterium]